MKKIRKSLLFFLVLLVSVLLITDNRLSALDTSFTETGGAGYAITQRKVTNQLDYGIKQFTDLGQTIRGGVFYNQQVNIFEIPTSSGVKVVSYANLRNHQWTKTTVRKFAHQYEAENPGWRVVGAVNGDFFDINGLGNFRFQTTNALVTDGEYFKTTSGTAVGFANDGSTNPLIAGTPKRTEYMRLAVYNESGAVVNEFDIEKLNAVPGENESAVYFGTYNADKNYVPITVPEEGYASAFYVENAEYALPNNTKDFYGRGVITKTSVQTVERGQFVILTNNQAISDALAVGVKIRAQFEYEGAFARATSITGHNIHFLTKGECILPATNDRHPRTMVGVRSDGTIVMAVVDGRQESIGMDGVCGNEMAAIMKKYNCVEAYNLDGGGSSTLIIRDGDDFKVMNSPSDGFERSDSNCLLIVTRDPEIEYEINTVTENSLTISASVGEAYLHRIDSLMVRVNNVTQSLVDGPATFENLSSSTQYRVEFFYKTPTGFNYKIPNIEENITTLKRPPMFFGLNLEESPTEYIFSTNYFDVDKTTNLAAATLVVNGTEYQLSAGLLALNRSEVGALTEVVLKYTVDRGAAEVETVILVNPQYKSTLVLNVIIDQTGVFVDKVYR